MAVLPAALVLMAIGVTDVHAHGHMIDPISRSSLSRFGYPVPDNPWYNGLNCGGQFDVDDGHRCGVCGDKYFAFVHENEAGGKYARGYITRNYTAGQIIVIKLDITVAHSGGWSEFKICPNNNINRVVSQSCLDAHLLATPSGQTRLYHPTYTGVLTFRLQLPLGLTCTQCVIQWTWKANSNPRYNSNGVRCVACGVQEHFRNCADVAISNSANSTLPMLSRDQQSTNGVSLLENKCQATPIGRHNFGIQADKMCREQCARGLCSFLMCMPACRQV